jgi:hypothetical protein
MGFVVDKVALGQVFSEYFGFSCQVLIPPFISLEEEGMRKITES